MKRFKYILKKLKTLEYKNMINIAKKIHKKTNKNTLCILFDMVRCAFKFGSGYMDYFEFEFYLLKDKEKKTYITSNINNDIIKKYNNPEFFDIFENKDIFNKKFKKYLNRSYINIEEKMLEDFIKFVKGKKRIVVKPLNQSGGKGVEVINLNKNTNLEKVFNSLIRNEQYLVEEYISQSAQMNKLYKSSVNTLRIITFYKDKKVYVLKSVLKIGNGGNVDNFSSGGMYTFVNEDGKVFVPAIDEEGNIFDKHPVSNTEIIGFKIPKYDEVINLVKKLGKVVPEVAYVGWDIAITSKGPVLVEGNSFSGIFQVKPSISGIKIGDLPNYRKYMDI